MLAGPRFKQNFSGLWSCHCVSAFFPHCCCRWDWAVSKRDGEHQPGSSTKTDIYMYVHLGRCTKCLTPSLEEDKTQDGIHLASLVGGQNVWSAQDGNQMAVSLRFATRTFLASCCVLSPEKIEVSATRCIWVCAQNVCWRPVWKKTRLKIAACHPGVWPDNWVGSQSESWGGLLKTFIILSLSFSLSFFWEVES